MGRRWLALVWMSARAACCEGLSIYQGGEVIDGENVIRHTEHELNSYLLEAVNYIQKWRAMMSASNVAIDGMPVEQGFKSKPPFCIEIMDTADRGLVALARLAIYTMNRELVPHRAMGGVAWSRGRPIGVAPVDECEEFDLNGRSTGKDAYAPIREWVEHLRVYVPTILRDPGAEPYVEDVWKFIRLSRSALNKPPAVWLTMAEVVEHFSVTEGTVANWASAGVVRVLDGYGEQLYLERDLKLYVEAAQESKYQANVSNIRRALKSRGIDIPAGSNT